MSDEGIDRCLQTISKWYFIKFYSHYHNDLDLNLIKNNPKRLTIEVEEHFSIVRGNREMNYGNLKRRIKCIQKILDDNCLDRAMERLLDTTKDRKILYKASNVYEAAHHRKHPYKLVY